MTIRLKRQMGIDLRQVIVANDERDITPEQALKFFDAYLAMVGNFDMISGGGCGLCDVNGSEDEMLRSLMVRVGVAIDLLEDGEVSMARKVLTDGIVDAELHGHLSSALCRRSVPPPSASQIVDKGVR